MINNEKLLECQYNCLKECLGLDIQKYGYEFGKSIRYNGIKT